MMKRKYAFAVFAAFSVAATAAADEGSFIQTENRGGPAFFSLKKKWNAACDAVQGTPPFNPKN